jgi:DNA-binding transcriptional ArsR family regulator
MPAHASGQPPAVQVGLEPALNALNSIALLTADLDRSLLDPWVAHTAAGLTPQQREINGWLFQDLGAGLIDATSWPSFEDYLHDLATADPTALRDRILACSTSPSRHVLITWLAPGSRSAAASAHTKRGSSLHDLPAKLRALLNDPPAFQDVLVTHLQTLWATMLAQEWSARADMLSQQAQRLEPHAFALDTATSTIEGALGRPLPTQTSLSDVTTILFVPALHNGRYVSLWQHDRVVRVLVGAGALGMRSQPQIGRGEVLARLRALTDDARLDILALLTQQGELSAQEIISRLGLSQSMASRHLKLLHSTGYILERRGNGANKSYRVAPHNLDRTFQALEQSLAGASADQMQRPSSNDGIQRFLDRAGRVMAWPTKQRDKQLVLEYLGGKFEPERSYTEREVNDLLNQWHTFGDHVTLRRALYEYAIINRERDGSRYWTAKNATATPPRQTVELRSKTGDTVGQDPAGDCHPD